jgi:hypothetical protein
MKPLPLWAAALVLAACQGGQPALPPSPSPSETELATPSATASGCVQPNDPNSHVYHPYRLQVIQPCITVTGVIDFKRKEADGDYHVGVKLDPQYADLVNDCNRTCLGGAEHGDLVVEPVCELSVTQADAVASCQGYRNPLVVPPVSSPVEVKGAYVLDVDHGWLEIHPAMSINAI